MARIYWDKTGTARALVGYFARRVSSPANLTLWRGDFAELITLYKDHCYTLPHTRAEYETLSKAEKKQVKDIGGFIGACLKKPYRADENVTGRDFITIDADAAPADFISRWKSRINKAAIIHSTASHTPKNPRYRLIIPLNSTIYLDGTKDADKTRYRGIITDLLELLDLLPYLDADGQRVEPVDMQASADLSRFMFWPCCCLDETPTLEIIEGELLDPARDYPLIRARLRSTQETPPPPLQAEQTKQVSGNGSGEVQTAQTLDAAFAALAGRTAPEAQTPAPMQEQGTPSEVNAETAARKLGSFKTDFKAMITAAAEGKDEAGRVIRTERKPEIKSDNLTKADKGFAQEIFDTRSWRFVPSTRDPKSGDEKFTGVTLRAINATQAEAVAQCYQDCRGHEDLFFNTIYGDLFRHAAGEDFLSKTIKRYIDTRPIFEYVLSELGVLEKLKSGLLSIARGSTKEHKTKRAYMPALAEILAGEDAIEELNIEWQDESTDGKDGRE